LFNYREDKYEDYIEVSSNTGLEGLIRSDLTTEVRDDIIVVALTEKRTPIYDLQMNKYSYISRSHGVYLSVTNDHHEDFIFAKNENNYLYKINKRYIDDGRLALIKKDSSLSFPKKISFNNSREKKLNQYFDYLTYKRSVSKDIINEIKNVISSNCNSEITLNVGPKLGANTNNIPFLDFSISFGVNSKIVLKEPGFKINFDDVSYLDKNGKSNNIFLYKRFTCSDNEINQLKKVTFTINDNSFSLDSNDLKTKFDQQWDTSLKENNVKEKMYMIKGYQDYYRLLNYLENESEFNTYLTGLKPDQRFFILNIMINEISYIYNPNT
jgi:hypothetical protein